MGAGGGSAEPAEGPTEGGSSASEGEIALSQLWRQSAEVRDSYLALAENEETLAADRSRTAQALEEAGALARMPVVEQASEDAAAVADGVRAALAEGGLAVREVRVETRPAGEPPPTEVPLREAFAYAPEQVVGVHEVTLVLESGLADGGAAVTALRGGQRLFVLVGARIDDDGSAVVTGEVPFFRPLEPVHFVIPDVLAEGEAALAAIVDTLDEEERERLASSHILGIRSNYELAGGVVRPAVERSLQHDAAIQVNTARMGQYTAWAQRAAEAPGWAEALR